MYKCKECGFKATVEPNLLKKTCDCKCGVVMDMGSATLVGMNSFRVQYPNVSAIIDLAKTILSNLKGQKNVESGSK